MNNCALVATRRSDLSLLEGYSGVKLGRQWVALKDRSNRILNWIYINSIPDSCNTAVPIRYPNGSRLFKRSPSITEGDALYCCNVHNCNHRGDIHDGPGISGFVAHLMVGNMYSICCFNVCRGVCFLFCLKRNHRTAVIREATGDCVRRRRRS
jgi:hypothetical protein